MISEIVEVIDAAADDPPVPQGWSVYHACYASHPELHRDGDWYYQPEGFEGSEAFSPGYESRSEALFACLGYQHEREAWLAALDEAHEHLDADLHHENPMTKPTETKYTACNGLNEAGLLHCPLPGKYLTREQARKAGQRNGLSHTVAVEGDRAFDMEPIHSTEDLIAAIRSDPRVGRGSCSSIDECYEDEELSQVLRDEGVTSKDEALAWAYETEGLWRDQGADAVACSGEPVDPYWTEFRNDRGPGEPVRG